jgi:hypothetical protein
MYRYRNAKGRYVYTNVAEIVPLEQRAAARVDLRHVSLNSQLGAAIDSQLKARYETLQQSNACAQARWQAREPWLKQLWTQLGAAGPFTLCGAIFVVLLALTPLMLSKGWGGPWARVLKTAIPLLGSVALAVFVMQKYERATSDLKLRSDRCQPQAWQKTAALPQRLQLVRALEADELRLERGEAQSLR